MDYQQDFKIIKQATRQYFKSFKDRSPAYHNQELLKEYLSNISLISSYDEFSQEEVFVSNCACLFYVMGFYSNSLKHLELSFQLARDYLSTANIDNSLILDVQKCILLPTDEDFTGAQKLYSDTLSLIYGASDFKKLQNILFREQAGYDGAVKVKRVERLKYLRSEMVAHTFFCQYSVDQWSDKKVKNLKIIDSQIAKHDKKEISKTKNSSNPHTYVSKEKDLPNTKSIDTMFKISAGNQQRLSTMADNKAHIMITVNSIILSAILTILLRKITDYSFLFIPTVIILLVSLLAMVFAILSTRPSLPVGKFSMQDLDDENVNLLFFGNFYKMTLEEYIYGMEKMMEDGDYLYRSLCKDIYMQGLVLGKKYKLLRLSYNIFMYGIVLSVLCFSIAALLYLY